MVENLQRIEKRGIVFRTRKHPTLDAWAWWGELFREARV